MSCENGALENCQITLGSKAATIYLKHQVSRPAMKPAARKGRIVLISEREGLMSPKAGDPKKSNRDMSSTFISFVLLIHK